MANSWNGSILSSIFLPLGLNLPNFNPNILFKGLFPLINYLSTKPLSLSQWAADLIANRYSNLNLNIPNLVSPELKFDPTKYGLTDYSKLFSELIQPLSAKNLMSTSLALLNSDDPTTLLLGKLETLDTIDKINNTSFFDEKSLSFEDKFNNSTFGKHFGLWSAGLDAANSISTALLGEKSEYDGEKGSLARGLDSVYDTISDGVSVIPGLGQAASLIMKGGRLLGGITNKLGGGTDGVTTTDAILGSAFLNITPFGLINGFGGRRTNTITKDNQLFADLGISYTGSENNVDEAVLKSGKKFGFFSLGAWDEANKEIMEADRQQKVMSGIANLANDRFAIRNSMAAINGNRRRFNMQGRYNQAAVRVGRNGLSLKDTAKKIVNQYNLSKKKFLKGGTLEDLFTVYFNSLPKYQLDFTDFRVRDYWEFNGRPKNFEEAIAKKMFSLEDDGLYHANSVAENPTTGEIEFMKSSSHPSHQKEVDWYYSDDGAEFRSQYELQKTEPYWKYVKRKSQVVESHQEGGPISTIQEKYIEPISTIKEIALNFILPEYKEGGSLENTIREIDLSNNTCINEFITSNDEIAESFKKHYEEYNKFKEGGKFNVIPEGALHARLHHMEDADNLTKKGIPVVSEKENGELEQLAEIERNEVILRLEVTKKIEELQKKYYNDDYTLKEKDEFAIEAGKLLTFELLLNTLDNTGLINEINI